MRRLGNTLYVTSQGTYLSKDGDCVLATRDDGQKTRIPIGSVDGIVAFGRVSASPFLLGLCAERGVTVSYFTEPGRFLARVEGPVSGNVLLRRSQYRAADEEERRTAIVRSILTGKLANQRTVLRRGRRDRGTRLAADETGALEDAIRRLTDGVSRLRRESRIDGLRGIEGECARSYYAVLPSILTEGTFRFAGRSRRPPKDPTNSLLSFVYALLTHDLRSAAEGVGLDPAVGFLHVERPGRPSLALDLVEEFRAWFADRLVLTLINRKQVSAGGFETGVTGGVTMTEETRKAVIVAYQERKREEIQHPFTGEKLPIGLLWHVQARLLAAHLREDLDAYPPFIAR